MPEVLEGIQTRMNQAEWAEEDVDKAERHYADFTKETLHSLARMAGTTKTGKKKEQEDGGQEDDDQGDGDQGDGGTDEADGNASAHMAEMVNLWQSTYEFLKDKGQVDMIVSRADMGAMLANLIDYGTSTWTDYHPNRRRGDE